MLVDTLSIAAKLSATDLALVARMGADSPQVQLVQ